MLIMISDAFDPSLAGKLAKFGEVTDDKSRQAEADVILIRSKTKATKEYIDASPKLKLIIRGGVGIDNIDTAYAKERGIQVNNTPKAPAIAVAELAFALMIAVPNHIIAGHTSMANGEWIKKQLKRTELFGKTLGLVGIGNIATEVAKRGAAFGMTVKAYDKYVDSSDHAEMVGSLEELAADADYISMHLPLTPETKGMIDSGIIAKMKDGAVLVNTGRGATVNADDVVAALESGKLGGYATDVWPSDPPAADYPIMKAPNVVMTPHLGASSKENLLRIGQEVVAIINEFVEGGKA
ncbi:MAG: hydroxyacid dehydrogenase [bacterium]|nr:hydroxyacid dehydrogenase [bacterium]